MTDREEIQMPTINVNPRIISAISQQIALMDPDTDHSEIWETYPVVRDSLLFWVDRKELSPAEGAQIESAFRILGDIQLNEAQALESSLEMNS